MIVIEKELSPLNSLLENRGPVFVVYDRNAAGFLPGTDFPSFAISADEKGKSIECILDICGWLLKLNAGRDAFLLAIGGGVTTDMAGFAASIYKRGIKFGFVPTTLLSQVDAAIGGKNGVNFKGLKNMLGSIVEPEFTFITPEVLKTLPEKEFRNGVAEMLKSFIISDDWTLYDTAVELFESNTASSILNSEVLVGKLLELVKAAVDIKCGIVGRDMHENGERRKLNLGHTFAHAIESLSSGGIPHGEAVSMGIVIAARLASALGLCEPDFVEMLEGDLDACGLPVECPFGIDMMASAMASDKKAEAGIIHFVLPVDIGDVRIIDLNMEKVCELLK